MSALLALSYPLLRPLLFRLDAEVAHDITLKLLGFSARFGLLPTPRTLPGTPVRAMGLKFPNAIGLAAGLDKHGAAVDALGAMGFGFIETGTFTPRPQDGNPHPRLFRSPADRALINRMGFNNPGIVHGVRNLRDRGYPGVLGINLGKNKVTPNEQALEDYRIGMSHSWSTADYLVINLSSPNTPGLRDLQQIDAAKRLFHGLRSEADDLERSRGMARPLLVKVAPDLAREDLGEIARAAIDEGLAGLIATNTTIERGMLPAASSEFAAETGGLSGAPLTPLAQTALEALAPVVRSAADFTLIASGGIMSAEDASARLRSGASLVQLYTGFVYGGPSLVRRCIEAAGAVSETKEPRHPAVNGRSGREPRRQR